MSALRGIVQSPGPWSSTPGPDGWIGPVEENYTLERESLLVPAGGGSIKSERTSPLMGIVGLPSGEVVYYACFHAEDGDNTCANGLVNLMYEQYANVLIFAFVAAAIVIAAIVFLALIRPAKPHTEKLTPYECGERPVGEPWIQFNIRYYVVCIIFLVFEVEVLFMLPWAVVFNAFRDGGPALEKASGGLPHLQGATGGLAFIEMLVFLVILAVGLAYVWAKGHLEWVREVTTPAEMRKENSVPGTGTYGQ